MYVSTTKKNGWLTAEVARRLTPYFARKGHDVYFDHGYRSEKNVGEIVCWYGKKYEREARLSHLDIAVVDRGLNNNVFALVEIEESTGKPKSLLADIFGTLMGEHFSYRGKKNLELNVGKWTTFFVIVRSSPSYEPRISYLTKKLQSTNATLPKLDTSIGKIVIRIFGDDTKLESMLKRQINLAIKRGNIMLQGSS